jgi:hypothetical protein
VFGVVLCHIFLELVMEPAFAEGRSEERENHSLLGSVGFKIFWPIGFEGGGMPIRSVLGRDSGLV